MKQTVKILALILALALIGTLAACSGRTEDDTYVVGICQQMTHAALDAATKGFQDALKEELGDKVTF